MSQYQARFAHGANDIPGVLDLDAKTDSEVKAKIDSFVVQGYRNQTWAAVELSTGENYCRYNLHGRVSARPEM